MSSGGDDMDDASPRRKRGLKGEATNGGADPKRAATKPIIECPPELSPVARQKWDRIVSAIGKTGLLMSVDQGTLAIYCGAYALWLEATEAMQKYGAVIKSPNGYPVQSPYMAIVNKQAEIMIKTASDLGFTPASRGRRWMLLQAPTSEHVELGDLTPPR